MIKQIKGVFSIPGWSAMWKKGGYIDKLWAS